MRSLYLAVAVAVVLGNVESVSAQAYPSRPISMNVPFAAGGPTDTITRIVAQRMSTLLRQSIIIENISGADGTIGVGRVARAAPDGYTPECRPVVDSCLERRGLRPALRPVEGFRTGCAACHQPAGHRHQQRRPRQGPEGIDRLG